MSKSNYQLNSVIFDILSEYAAHKDNISEYDYTHDMHRFIQSYCYEIEEADCEILVNSSTFRIRTIFEDTIVSMDKYSDILAALLMFILTGEVAPEYLKKN